MPQPSADFIDGHPDVMMGYAAEGPAPVQPGAQEPLVSVLGPEGTALVNADRTATMRLLTFVTEANRRVDHLTLGAQTSGRIYLDAEDQSQAAIIGVAALDPHH
jgi:hypothetical protein